MVYSGNTDNSYHFPEKSFDYPDEYGYDNEHEHDYYYNDYNGYYDYEYDFSEDDIGLMKGDFYES